jgi:hypothetical protein
LLLLLLLLGGVLLVQGIDQRPHGCQPLCF